MKNEIKKITPLKPSHSGAFDCALFFTVNDSVLYLTEEWLSNLSIPYSPDVKSQLLKHAPISYLVFSDLYREGN